jgi:hypothetical protein
MTVHVYPQPRDGAGPFAAAILGLIICAVALPVVLLLGGPLAGWFIGTVLWVANWTASNMMTKFALNSGQKAAVGVAGVSMMGRAFTVVIILYIIAARISHPIGLTAAAVFMAAFSFDLMGRVMLFSIQERAHQTPTSQGPADS